MSSFGTTPLSTTTLGVNQFPVSAVAVPNTSGGNLTALQGGPASTDNNGNVSAPAAMYVPDGNDVAQGTTTDAAWSGTGPGTNIAILKKVVAELAATLNINLVQVAGSNITNTNPVPAQDIEQAGYTSAVSPPTTTTAGSDTLYTFSAQVSRVIIQNNTSANVNYAFDATASAGSLLLVPGAMLVYPKKCTVLHLYTAAAQNINGTAATNNIVVLGAL